MQQGHTLGDVGLPPWANGSADEFVRLTAKRSGRSTSRHIFTNGSTSSSGTEREARAESLNVFYYLTYEGAVDSSARSSGPIGGGAADPVLQATLAQPISRPHEPRKPRSKIGPSCQVFDSPEAVKVYHPRSLPGGGGGGRPIVYVSAVPRAVPRCCAPVGCTYTDGSRSSRASRVPFTFEPSAAPLPTSPTFLPAARKRRPCRARRHRRVGRRPLAALVATLTARYGARRSPARTLSCVRASMLG